MAASSAASLPELVGDAGFALDPDDVQGMAGAILACLVDDTLAGLAAKMNALTCSLDIDPAALQATAVGSGIHADALFGHIALNAEQKVQALPEQQ
jgi:hypothetical protein